jgi:hypothetical protein
MIPSATSATGTAMEATFAVAVRLGGRSSATDTTKMGIG